MNPLIILTGLFILALLIGIAGLIDDKNKKK